MSFASLSSLPDLKGDFRLFTHTAIEVIDAARIELASLRSAQYSLRMLFLVLAALDV